MNGTGITTTKNGASSTPKAVKSAQRIIQVLRCFSEYRRPLRLAEICAELDLPPSSASGLLKTLLHMGYCNYSGEDRTYFPTWRVASLGDWLHEIDKGEQLRYAMEELSRRTQETVILAAEVGIFVQYTNVIQGTQSERFYEVGSRRLLSKANLGIALLSLKSDGEVGKIVRRINHECAGEGEHFETAQVLKLVHACRKQDFAYTPNIMTHGAGVIATPLQLERGPLAIGIGGPTKRLDENKKMFLRCLMDVKSNYFRDHCPPQKEMI